MKKLFLVTCLAMLMATSAFAGQLIVNGGFETGGLSPWFNGRDFCGGTCSLWAVTATNPHTGLFSAMDIGNIELKQTFTPTPGSSITGVSFWIFSGAGLNAFDLFYTDGTDAEFTVLPTPDVWTFEDVTSSVDTTKTLMGFSVFGTDPSFTTFVDDVSVTSAVPEPSSLLMIGGGILALAGSVRRKLMS